MVWIVAERDEFSNGQIEMRTHYTDMINRFQRQLTVLLFTYFYRKIIDFILYVTHFEEIVQQKTQHVQQWDVKKLKFFQLRANNGENVSLDGFLSMWCAMVIRLFPESFTLTAIHYNIWTQISNVAIQKMLMLAILAKAFTYFREKKRVFR